eukprot:g56661.t1
MSEPESRVQSLLSDSKILECMEKGTIVIDPFVPANLSTSSYDVTLGKYYYRESQPEPGMAVYNPYSSEMVKRVWGDPMEAERAGDWMARTGTKLENIAEDDHVIWISPGETILGHTIEWIGGRRNVTTMMKARSSMGRNFIEVCKCAGWGDIGYVNRWTMEITNNSRHYSIPLVVGRRIAQIIFFGTDMPVGEGSYASSGKYQCSDDIQEIKANWNPIECLPKMYKDREIAAGPVADAFEPSQESWEETPLLSQEYKKYRAKHAGKHQENGQEEECDKSESRARKRAKASSPVDFDKNVWAINKFDYLSDAPIGAARVTEIGTVDYTPGPGADFLGNRSIIVHNSNDSQKSRAGILYTQAMIAVFTQRSSEIGITTDIMIVTESDQEFKGIPDYDSRIL